MMTFRYWLTQIVLKKWLLNKCRRHNPYVFPTSWYELFAILIVIIQCQFQLFKHRVSLSVLTAIFQVNLDLPVFIDAKDDGGGGDNWTTGAISCAKLQSYHHYQQTNIQFLLKVGCPSCRPTNNVKALSLFVNIGEIVFSLFATVCMHVLSQCCKLSQRCCTLQAQLAAKSATNKPPPSESITATKSKSKRKMSEGKECENEAPVIKKEQAKPKQTKDKGSKAIL